MVPLVGSATEFKYLSSYIKGTIADVIAEYKQMFPNSDVNIDIRIGTMIEVPRAALTAKEVIQAGAEFFSYGTNDLTQMTYGFSRDDIGGYLPTYLKKGILEKDPFQNIDEAGVGQLIEMSATIGKETAAKTGLEKFKAGVCGEHGGDPQSVRFFSRIGLDYVSCSPFRVPLARLAAAQSVIEEEKEAADK